jgi:uncharacterized protein YbjT (DUF2867 family)
MDRKTAPRSGAPSRRAAKTRVAKRSPRVLLTGATGFVGGRLYPALVANGCVVRCASRDPARAETAFPGREWVYLDVDEPDTLEPALAGCSSAVYLVHGMAEGGAYQRREEAAARAFARAARRAGVERVVYLGGVQPHGHASKHLESRRVTGEALRTDFPGTVELRAGMIVGAGSESWRICRDLASRLPVMVLPRWLRSRSQPVAIQDVVAALRAALTARVPPGCYDLPGPETLSAREILVRIARLRGMDPLMVSVPVVTPKLSSYWIRWVTDANAELATELVEGLRSDLIATGPSLWDRIPRRSLVTFDEAARKALAEEPSPSLGAFVVESLARAVGPLASPRRP